jgi:hypothetical protein
MINAASGRSIRQCTMPQCKMRYLFRSFRSAMTSQLFGGNWGLFKRLSSDHCPSNSCYSLNGFYPPRFLYSLSYWPCHLWSCFDTLRILGCQDFLASHSCRWENTLACWRRLISRLDGSLFIKASDLKVIETPNSDQNNNNCTSIQTRQDPIWSVPLNGEVIRRRTED